MPTINPKTTRFFIELPPSRKTAPGRTSIQEITIAASLNADNLAAVSDGRAALEPKLSDKRRFVLAAPDAVDRQVPELLGDLVKRAEGVGRAQTDADGWAQLLDARLSTREQLPAVVSVPLTSKSKR